MGLNIQHRQTCDISDTLVGNNIACRRYSNYIFIRDLTHGFYGLGEDNDKTRRASFKFWNLLSFILDTLR